MPRTSFFFFKNLCRVNLSDAQVVLLKILHLSIMKSDILLAWSLLIQCDYSFQIHTYDCGENIIILIYRNDLWFLFSHYEILHSLFKYSLFYTKKMLFYFLSSSETIKKLSHLIKILHYLFYWCGTSIRSQLYYTDSILFRNFLFLIWILYFIAPLHQRMYICGCKIFNVELQSLFDVNLSVWQTILSFPWLLRFAALDLSQPEP